MRIFMIDDEPAVIERFHYYLERSHHTLEWLSCIEEDRLLRSALERFRPHAVILDYEMRPGGLACLASIRAWDPAVPVVFYTKYGDSLDRRHRMIEAGADEEMIIKKRAASDDVRTILRLLEQREG
jgi:DNA-binding response OmpR family regulator